MKLLLLIFISLTINSFPQEANHSFKTDSIYFSNYPGDNIIFQLDEFEFYKDLTESRRKAFINSESSQLWLKISAELSTKNSFNEKSNLTPGYLHAHLYEQFKENSKLNTFRTALGMIQAGIVGYLAYRHIKKYVLKK